MTRLMKVSGLTMDPYSNTPIIILKEVDGDRSLPIWIGLLEATSIATQLENIEFPRPMTHDLIKNLMNHLGIKVEKVEVCDLKDNTFYAFIYIQNGDKVSRIDSRPSDAIAIALRTQAPIYVREEVIEMSKGFETVKGEAELTDEEAKKWTEVLESLSPEDFGKYKM